MRLVYFYMRCSGYGQVDGDTWERQMDSLNRWIKSQEDLPFVSVYRESGVTGKIEDRPALGEMLCDIKEARGAVSMVVVSNLDRFARDVIVQENLIRDLAKMKVEVYSIAEPDLGVDDPLQPGRRLIRVILGAVAEHEAAMIVLRTRAKRERMRKAGESCEGRKPYGAHPDKPFESEVLKTIRVMHSNGMNFRQIASALNSKNLGTRTGRLWFPATVRRIALR